MFNYKLMLIPFSATFTRVGDISVDTYYIFGVRFYQKSKIGVLSEHSIFGLCVHIGGIK